MKQVQSYEMWPPPDWTEVIILWDDIHKGPQYPIRDILDWVDSTPGGRYHLHGYGSTEGFAFRFERAEDATYFKLRWL
jgi:hypothetical protein